MRDVRPTSQAQHRTADQWVSRPLCADSMWESEVPRDTSRWYGGPGSAPPRLGRTSNRRGCACEGLALRDPPLDLSVVFVAQSPAMVCSSTLHLASSESVTRIIAEMLHRSLETAGQGRSNPVFETTPEDCHNCRVAPKPRTRSASQPWMRFGTETHTFSARGNVVACGACCPESLRRFQCLLGPCSAPRRAELAPVSPSNRPHLGKLATFFNRGELCVFIS